MKKEDTDLLEEKEPIEPPKYSDEEKEYRSALRRKLTKAKEIREEQHEEFDNMSYEAYFDANERGANTYINTTKNKGETNFQSGTLRTKLFAVLSSMQSLNLSPDIMAYNESEIELSALGNAAEDIIERTNDYENDKEKRMLRQYEMLKQGTVFVEDMWIDKWIKEKKINKKFDGKIEDIKITTTEKKEFGMPEKNILSGLSVFLGNIRVYDIREQPYVFTVEFVDRETARQIYGKWDRWQNVNFDISNFESDIDSEEWRLYTEEKEDMVEIVKYQDKPNNEFQIIINGVTMLPMGFPLTEVSPDGEYTIIQQNLEPIKENFAYGKSFIFKNKDIVSILDNMMQMAVLKTQKSYFPPYLNLSGRVLSKDIFMPGRITSGIQRGDVIPLSEDEAKGVTNAEFNMIAEVKSFIDSNTVSPTFQGQKEQGTITATQTLSLQNQSRLMMAMTTLAATLLEIKLTEKRLTLVLKNWFEPVGTRLDGVRNKIIDTFRVTSVPKMIRKEGLGMETVLPTKEELTPEEIGIMEIAMERQMRKPVRIIVLNPEEIKKAKLIWKVNVVAKEEKSSELAKMMFKDFIVTGMNIGLPFDMEYVAKRYAEYYNEDPAKMFTKQQPQTEEQTGVANTEGTPKVSPTIKLPNERGLNEGQ